MLDLIVKVVLALLGPLMSFLAPKSPDYALKVAKEIGDAAEAEIARREEVAKKAAGG